MAGFEALNGYKATKKFEGNDTSGGPMPGGVLNASTTREIRELLSQGTDTEIVAETFHVQKIPVATLEKVKPLLARPKAWVNLPKPIRDVLKEAGFMVHIKKKGTVESPGDIVTIKGTLSDGIEEESIELDTEKVVEYVKRIAESQEETFVQDEKNKKENHPIKKAIRSNADQKENTDRDSNKQLAQLDAIRKEALRAYKRQKTPDTTLDLDVSEETSVVPESTQPDTLTLANNTPEEQETGALPKEKFHSPEDDPIVRQVEEEIIQATNKDSAVMKTLLQPKAGGMNGYGNVWERVNARESMHRWYNFVTLYPEKAELYKERHPGIKHALERLAERQTRENNTATVDEEAPAVFRKNRRGVPEEQEIVTAPKEKFFDERFVSDFGITKEQLFGIEGFEKLSSGQQKLVYENLKEYASQAPDSYLARAWEGVQEAFGVPDEGIPSRGGNGMNAYGKVLEQLVVSSAIYGPKVHEEGGKVIPEFISVDLQGKREHRPELREILLMLNERAGVLSRTPAEWQNDGIGTHSEDESRLIGFFKDTFSTSRKNYNTYQERLSSYESAKKKLNEALEKAGFGDAEIAQKLVEVDKNVYELQFQQTSPEAIEAIKDIPDAGFWKDVGRSLVKKSNIAYLGLGFMGRTVLSGSLGMFAAPTVAAAFAGTRSWNRTAAELRERDRAARGGQVDASNEALNIISAQSLREVQGVQREVGVTKKLQDLIDTYKTMAEDVSEKERNELLDRIKTRATYIEDKQKLNRINFGSKEERAANVASLYETLAMAKMIVADNHNMPKSALEEKLGKILWHRENSMQNKRRTLQTKKVAWNALRAGAFAGAGVMLADYVRESGLGEKAMKFVEDVVKGQPSVAETPQALGSYAIKSGDTLTKVLKEQIPGIKALESTHAQENAIANILRSLSSEELKIMGIRSGNPDLIYAGDTIDMDMLNSVIESQKSVLDSAKERFGEVPQWNHYESADTETLTSESVSTPSSEEVVSNEGVETPDQITESEPKSAWSEMVTKDKVQIIERFFNQDTFGAKWDTIKRMPVAEFLKQTTGAGMDAQSKESMQTLAEMMQFAAQSPSKIAPIRGEMMESYLRRVYLTVVEYQDQIPRGKLAERILRMIEKRYV